jgi:hypothetical protein
MALTADQKITLSDLLRREDARQTALGNNAYIVDFILLSRPQQIAAARVLVQAERDLKDAKLTALPTETAAATTVITSQRDNLNDIDTELQGV